LQNLKAVLLSHFHFKRSDKETFNVGFEHFHLERPCHVHGGAGVLAADVLVESFVGKEHGLLEVAPHAL